ncbi:MAG: hypothetical protein HC900_02535, partial [Methylacidiphilales bacterium]|nr:hypothetical protein [Candidatus Methylacidiphilales bacterium]
MPESGTRPPVWRPFGTLLAACRAAARAGLLSLPRGPALSAISALSRARDRGRAGDRSRRAVPAELTCANLLFNVLMFPIGLPFVMPDSILLPQAWSLGLEAFFYLVFPWLIIFPLRGIAFALSVLVFALAITGILDTELFGYKLLPGTLFMFLIGSHLFDDRKARVSPVAFASLAVLGSYYGLTLLVPALARPYSG